MTIGELIELLEKYPRHYVVRVEPQRYFNVDEMRITGLRLTNRGEVTIEATE
jgi:hypothetical protein